MSRRVAVFAAALASVASLANAAIRGGGATAPNPAPHVGAGAPHCFDLLGNFCWQWSINASTISFTMVCKPVVFVQPAWCAVGLNINGSTGMAPAEVFWVSVLKNNSVSVESRLNPGGHTPPSCLTPQLSTPGASSVDASGTITATWTRPLSAAGTFGYVDIVPGSKQDTVAAWAVKKDQQDGECMMGWGEHASTYKNSATW